jgi:hypothetical protein
MEVLRKKDKRWEATKDEASVVTEPVSFLRRSSGEVILVMSGQAA